MWATETEIPEIEDFLGRHAVRSMFPLANLRDHGLNKEHPRSPRFWLTREGGEIVGVLQVSQEGMVMPQNPDMNWVGIPEALKDLDLVGLIGPANQCRSLQKALKLLGVPTSLDHDEPQYSLDLENLVVPEGIGDIVPLAQADKDEMIRWRYEYELEALGMTPDEAKPIAEQDYASYCAAQSHVTLMDGDDALCTTGFNARLPDIVQIGGVFTPPHLRGQGHARRAVALHLQQARALGVKRATLFSANEFASRAYQAIGFTYIGQWTLCLFKGKQRANV